jgi:hypothetical protein
MGDNIRFGMTGTDHHCLTGLQRYARSQITARLARGDDHGTNTLRVLNDRHRDRNSTLLGHSNGRSQLTDPGYHSL